LLVFLHTAIIFSLAAIEEEDSMSVHTVKGLVVACLVLSIGFLFGCAGREFYPKHQIWYYHSELPAADRALAAAKAAGKDKECPDAYKNAEKMRDDAYNTYWACRTQEAIAKANEATAMAKGLCPKPPPPPPMKVTAPPPPPPMAAPTVSLMASPSSIDKGKCADLSWTSTNASAVAIDQGIGSVAAGGSRQVCPDATTQYMVTAKGEGGTRTASTTVHVVPPPPPAAPVPIDKLTIHVNFDVNKAQVRKEDIPDLQKALAFVKKYPGYKISVEGHTDSTGSEKYNQDLSVKRAEAVKKYLLDNGATDGDKFKTAGFGETKPIASNKTAKGRFENRRVEILIFSR
jgi:outer membrane protein OmpA-like peptidoglycan-associated protein